MKTNKTVLINMTKGELEALICPRVDGGNCDRYSPSCKNHLHDKITVRAKMIKEFRKIK